MADELTDWKSKYEQLEIKYNHSQNTIKYLQKLIKNFALTTKNALNQANKIYADNSESNEE